MPPRIGNTMEAVNDAAAVAILDGTTSRPVMYSRGPRSSSSSSNSHSNSTSSVSLLGLASRRLRWVVAAVTLLTVLARPVDAVCDPDRWWNPERSECVPCRVCDGQQLVMRPCQEYMDTVCGTMKDLDMDLASGLARTEEHHEDQQRHWKEERRKDGAHRRSHNDHDAAQQRHQHPQQSATARHQENTEDIMWDWQAASLLLAIIGCLLFFFAAAIIALNQTRQWKRIEKHFDADMEALSVQLMNHLSSMQQLENGSIFLDDVIGGPSVEPRRFRSGGGGGGSTSSTSGLLSNAGIHHHHHHHPIEVRCVYLDQLLDGKGCTKQQGPGNLYIEEHNGGPPGNNGGPLAAGNATTLTTAGRMY